jgi:dihydroxyacetone kinase-like predicted kinase
VTRFADQFSEGSGPADQQGDGSEPARVGDGVGSAGGRRAVLAAADGPGLRALFQAGGARLLPGRPATAQILAEVEAAGSEVVLLPNDPDTHAVAAAAADRARAGGVTVVVLPTRSPVQGLAALAVRDPTRDFAADLAAMGEAADGCRYAEVVTAASAADTAAGRCRAGDALGFVDGAVRLLAAQPGPVAADLLDLLLGEGGELVTVVLGAAAPAGLAETLREHLTRRWPGVEAHLHVGGQPHQLLLLGVE